jgi:large subunit ribosomal protein L18
MQERLIALKKKRRIRRKKRIRKTLAGTKDCPRLSVFRSNRHISVQAIDDDTGSTIASASTLALKDANVKLNMKSAEKIGKELASKLKEKKISKAVFDRNGFLYTGKIKVLADAIRKEGLKF